MKLIIMKYKYVNVDATYCSLQSKIKYQKYRTDFRGTHHDFSLMTWLVTWCSYWWLGWLHGVLIDDLAGNMVFSLMTWLVTWYSHWWLGIFWPLCCLFFFFYVWLLITSLVSFGHCVVSSSSSMYASDYLFGIFSLVIVKYIMVVILC